MTSIAILPRPSSPTPTKTEKQKRAAARRKKKMTTSSPKRKKAAPARSNKGGAVRGKARAAQVKRMKGTTLTVSTMKKSKKATDKRSRDTSKMPSAPLSTRVPIAVGGKAVLYGTSTDRDHQKKKVVAKKRTVKKKANPSGANKTAARIRTYNKGKGANTRGTTGFKKKTAAMLKKGRRKGTLAR